MVDKLLDPQHINPQQVRERKEGQKVKQKERYDKHAQDLPELNIGQTVRLQNMHNNRWSPKWHRQSQTAKQIIFGRDRVWRD